MSRQEVEGRTWVSGTPRLWVRHPGGARQCPGCHHPIIERLIAETVDELGVEDDTVLVTGVGCSTRAFAVLDMDGIFTPHGRAPDAGTAIKRALHGRPVVITLQGDGDCIAIGAGSLLSAVGRAERLTIIMVNNGNYGTTGGQMAPTTLHGQVTTTTPRGRDDSTGYPMHAPELLATLKGCVYAARGAVHTPANYQRTRKYLKTAVQKQIDNVGFSFVEILSACPPDWRLTPVESLRWIEEHMIPEFPLGEFKNLEHIE
jgi:2-oxoglutarate ferredoxin oxidoreductase subunit beta